MALGLVSQSVEKCSFPCWCRCGLRNSGLHGTYPGINWKIRDVTSHSKRRPPDFLERNGPREETVCVELESLSSAKLQTGWTDRSRVLLKKPESVSA